MTQGGCPVYCAPSTYLQRECGLGSGIGLGLTSAAMQSIRFRPGMKQADAALKAASMGELAWHVLPA
ncbi:hypothetical protein GFGA_1d0894 [Gluconobacter frateurii NBRC 103465]|nr:hypothetical protein GFGA_1d0894 [Gluconobacter frateurii NBRC 103465]